VSLSHSSSSTCTNRREVAQSSRTLKGRKRSVPRFLSPLKSSVHSHAARAQPAWRRDQAHPHQGAACAFCVSQSPLQRIATSRLISRVDAPNIPSATHVAHRRAIASARPSSAAQNRQKGLQSVPPTRTDVGSALRSLVLCGQRVKRNHRHRHRGRQSKRHTAPDTLPQNSDDVARAARLNGLGHDLAAFSSSSSSPPKSHDASTC